MEEHERRRNSAPVAQPKVVAHRLAYYVSRALHWSRYLFTETVSRTYGDWTRRQSAVEAPQHPRVDPVSERQQILESILRTTRWPTTNNVAAVQDVTQFNNGPISPTVKTEDVPEVRPCSPCK